MLPTRDISASEVVIFSRTRSINMYVGMLAFLFIYLYFLTALLSGENKKIGSLIVIAAFLHYFYLVACRLVR